MLTFWSLYDMSLYWDQIAANCLERIYITYFQLMNRKRISTKVFCWHSEIFNSQYIAKFQCCTFMPLPWFADISAETAISLQSDSAQVTQSSGERIFVFPNLLVTVEGCTGPEGRDLSIASRNKYVISLHLGCIFITTPVSGIFEFLMEFSQFQTMQIGLSVQNAAENGLSAI